MANVNEPLRFEMCARTFRCGTFVSLKEYTLRDGYSDRNFLPLSSLPPQIIGSFYKKDAALYKHPAPFYEDVFEVVWKAWYPRRNLHPAIDKAWEGFFCRTIKPRSGEGRFEIRQLVDFHEALVKALDAREKGDAGVGETLVDTFRWVFVVVDKEDWEHDGCLVVCRTENVAKLGVDPSDSEKVEEKDVWVTFRMSVEDAVKTVIWDPERRKATAPTLEKFRAPKFAI
ncbi:hypothetical protein EMPG_09818 [Blastomyces silverae]|uniref:Uncharacterized protein n=1 Tax=Blastomyces silverae TaxID=2060906 RepID=A0A0H1BP05_9EURO|nr:hypothetical protein EMPG_09818 [Blastomyces silverae]